VGVFDRKVAAVAACVVCTALVLGVFLTFTIWAPDWIGDFRMNRGPVMLVFAASGILMNVAMPGIGAVLTRIPPWRVILGGGILLGGGLVLDSFVRAPVVFFVLYALIMGFGVALAGILPCQALAVRLYPSRIGSIGGMMMVALAVTGVIFPFALIPLKAAIGWRLALAGLGAVVLIIVPLLALAFMRGVVEHEPGQTGGAHGAHGAGGPKSSGPIVRTRAFWVMVAGILPMLAVASAIQANMLPILADRGVVQTGASLVLSALAVGTAIGAGLFGWLADRIDPRLAIIAASLLIAACLLVLAGGNGATLAEVGAFTLGVGAGGISPLMSTFALRRFGTGYAPAFGLLNFFMIPYILGAPLLGFVRDRTGSYDLILLVAAPLVVLGAVGMWSLRSAKAAAPVPAPALPDRALNVEAARF
jgi:MFS transporter, OFA family, oxalate/formate antiporter